MINKKDKWGDSSKEITDNTDSTAILEKKLEQELAQTAEQTETTTEQTDTIV